MSAARGFADRVRSAPQLSEPGWVLLPLRAFLGVTFCYASILKLTDPAYLDSSAPSGVHAQMLHAARTSPIGPLVRLSADVPDLTGLLIAFGELAVGLGVLLGLWTRLAALGGLLLSLSFFLTVSWRTHPYFFGSDVVFVFAWTPLLLAGDGGVLSVTAAVRARVAAGMGLRPGRPIGPAVASELTRRTVVVTGALAAGLGVLAGLTGGLSAFAAHRRGRRSAAPKNGSPTPRPTTARSSGTALGPAASVPVGGSASFTDPRTGAPGLVVQPVRGEFRAFSAVCTHAGCTVGYQGGAFVCPCHGSVFDGRTGAVLTGPAGQGLPAIAVTVVDGTVYEG
jgi:thiosulfate dehydrogenase [quinone] large subunit